MALTPKVLNVSRVEYLPAIFSGTNKSGVEPVGDRVLILPDMAMATSTGNIRLPDDVVERMQLSSSSGVIVACGDDAFAWNSDRTRPFSGYKPKQGDRVHFEKYAGKEIIGDDGVKYRLCDDKAIGGVKKSV
jgi:co-chaperonin GroES (HSP10)